jgi:lipopolysaccharide biosynthesis glycosyltransferase
MSVTNSDRPGTRPIRLIAAADSAYVLPLAVAVRSALETTSQPLEVLVLDGGLTAQDRQRLLESWPESHVDVHWLTLETAQLETLPVWGRMTSTTYCRLLLAGLVPHHWTRALWLDCDVLLRRDLAALWDLEMGDRAVLAARDLVVPCLGSRYGVSPWKELGLDPRAPHFNAGVMLLDLERWRAEHIGERAIDYLRKYGDRVCFFDQEALNAVAVNRWGELDPRWNHIASMAGQAFLDASHLDPAVYRQVVENPFLVHYSGYLKPWKCRGATPNSELWYGILDRTSFAGWRPAATLQSMALGLYMTTLRPWLYPLEAWYIQASRAIRK